MVDAKQCISNLLKINNRLEESWEHFLNQDRMLEAK